MWKWQMKGFGFGYPRGFWYPAKEPISYEEIKVKAKELLEKASKGATWTNPWGLTRTPIIIDNQITGWLLEDTDLKDLEIGAYKYTKFGMKVQLVKNGKVVGELWLAY